MKNSSFFQMIAKFEFLNTDETVREMFTARVIDGSLSATRANGVRRSISLTVDNLDNAFTPSPLRFWVNDRFKLSLGYMIYGEPYYLPQGTFVLRNPTTLHDKSQKEATISGVDKWAALDGTLNGRLDATYSIPISTSIKTAISSVLSLCNDPLNPLLIVGSDITPYTIYQDLGNSYADVLLELNKIISHNMYYDVQGIFNCQPDVSNLTKGSVWDFITSTAVYQSISQEFKFENAYNIVQVVGDNVNGNIATGKATNNDPSSALSILNIGPRLAPIINDSVIDTDQRAQDRANYELKRYASMAVEATITCIPLLHLDVDQIITVTDERELLDRERFLINGFTLPLSPKGGQTMTLNISKSSEIDFNITN